MEHSAGNIARNRVIVETYGQPTAARTMAISRFFDVVMRISERTCAKSRISRACASGYWTLVQYPVRAFLPASAHCVHGIRS
ncbi:hypothetical protein GCT13_21265 [Paraburkholderia sp. CNPSo 3157]|uniref:Uncharacterized protein n=1 Tax=Paraburkholderia franconis TaxID=2654983 RepID=A0A7X1THI6_9BURK|nr:hypothetical protein [Paraburkholderia franconis]